MVAFFSAGDLAHCPDTIASDPVDIDGVGDLQSKGLAGAGVPQGAGVGVGSAECTPMAQKQRRNCSQALRAVVETIAGSLGWRVVKTRREVGGDGAEGGGGGEEMSVEEIAARITAARAVFDEFDADGSGSIDAQELMAALDATDVQVSGEEVLELLAMYDSNNTGEV